MLRQVLFYALAKEVNRMANVIRSIFPVVTFCDLWYTNFYGGTKYPVINIRTDCFLLRKLFFVVRTILSWVGKTQTQLIIFINVIVVPLLDNSTLIIIESKALSYRSIRLFHDVLKGRTGCSALCCILIPNYTFKIWAWFPYFFVLKKEKYFMVSTPLFYRLYK